MIILSLYISAHVVAATKYLIHENPKICLLVLQHNPNSPYLFTQPCRSKCSEQLHSWPFKHMFRGVARLTFQAHVQRDWTADLSSTCAEGLPSWPFKHMFRGVAQVTVKAHVWRGYTADLGRAGSIERRYLKLYWQWNHDSSIARVLN